MHSGILLLAVGIVLQQSGITKGPANSFTSKSAGFSVAFPGTPTESFRTEKTEAGPRIHKIFEFAEPGKSYRVICAELGSVKQPRLRQTQVDGILDVFTRSLNGKLIEQKKVKFQGESGVEASLELENGIGHGIYFIKGNRLFQITLYYADPKRDDPAEFKRYVDSFRVFPAVGKLTEGMDELTTWQDYQSSEGGYRIKTIGKPTERTQKFEMPGGPVDVKLIRFLGPKGENFGVHYSPLPRGYRENDPDRLMEQLAQGTAASLKGKVETRRSITDRQFSGSEVLISMPGNVPFNDGVYLARFYPVGDRLFQLIFVGPRDRMNQPEVLEFFQSFQLDAGQSGKTPPGK